MNDTNPQPSEPTPQPQRPQIPDRLSQKQIGELMNAYTRYVELTERLKSPLVTPESGSLQAEHAGLEKFLAARFLERGFELLGCLIAVRNEYEPLCKGIGAVLAHTGIIQALTAARVAPTTPAANE